MSELYASLRLSEERIVRYGAGVVALQKIHWTGVQDKKNFDHYNSCHSSQLHWFIVRKTTKQQVINFKENLRAHNQR